MWVSHRLTCERCLTSRKLSWRQARWALQHGRMELPPRATFPAYARAVFDETSRMPQERELEPIVKNPKRGPWDLYVRGWLVVVPSLIVGLIVVQQIP